MRFIFLFLLCCTNALHAQPVVYINAGSRAHYGFNQELIINKNGQSSYYLRQVNGPAKDSLTFILTASQLDAFFSKATSTGFFSLERNYDAGAADGAGIYISMNNAGKKYSVNVVNADVPQINDLVNWLNGILSAFKIQIRYKASLPKRK